MDTFDLFGSDNPPVIASISIDFDVFDTSSDYDVFARWPLGKHNVIDFGDSSTRTESRTFEWLPPVRDSSGWYWTVSFEILDDSSDFIEVYIFLDPEGNVDRAAAYDSDGNWYDVPLTVE